MSIWLEGVGSDDGMLELSLVAEENQDADRIRIPYFMKGGLTYRVEVVGSGFGLGDVRVSSPEKDCTAVAFITKEGVLTWTGKDSSALYESCGNVGEQAELVLNICI